ALQILFDVWRQNDARRGAAEDHDVRVHGAQRIVAVEERATTCDDRRRPVHRAECLPDWTEAVADLQQKEVRRRVPQLSERRDMRRGEDLVFQGPRVGELLAKKIATALSLTSCFATLTPMTGSP